jgi:hypothetical protein
MVASICSLSPKFGAEDGDDGARESFEEGPVVFEARRNGSNIFVSSRWTYTNDRFHVETQHLAGGYDNRDRRLFRSAVNELRDCRLRHTRPFSELLLRE